MQLDYAQLAALVAVVREGSFEAAARALHLTPSALSQRIKALEQRVGGLLLVRAKPCTVTPLGEPLLRHAQQVALLERGLLDGLAPPHAAARAPGPPPELAVAVNADSLSTWFMDAAARFARASGALLDLRVDDEGHTQEALRRGEVLAAVTTHAAPLQGCRSLRLGALRYRACASPAFVARHFAAGLNATSLAQAPSLRFNAKDELQWRWLRRLLRRELHPPSHRLPSSQGFVQACEAGLGWALNPEPLVADAMAAGRLVDLAPQLPIDVPLVWQCTRLELPLLRTMTEAVQAAAARGLAQR